jgi:hypothetical protein
MFYASSRRRLERIVLPVNEPDSNQRDQQAKRLDLPRPQWRKIAAVVEVQNRMAFSVLV